MNSDSFGNFLTCCLAKPSSPKAVSYQHFHPGFKSVSISSCLWAKNSEIVCLWRLKNTFQALKSHSGAFSLSWNHRLELNSQISCLPLLSLVKKHHISESSRVHRPTNKCSTIWNCNSGMFFFPSDYHNSHLGRFIIEYEGLVTYHWDNVIDLQPFLKLSMNQWSNTPVQITHDASFSFLSFRFYLQGCSDSGLYFYMLIYHVWTTEQSPPWFTFTGYGRDVIRLNLCLSLTMPEWDLWQKWAFGRAPS